MSEKRKMKTLFSRRGKTWMNDVSFPPSVLTLSSSLFAKGSKGEDELDKSTETLIQWLLTKRQPPKAASYIASEEFHELERRVKALEKRLLQSAEVPQAREIDAVLNLFISQTENMKEVRSVHFQQREKSLNFFVVAEYFSSGLLERISQAEIVLSRKFSDLSIEIEPIVRDEDVPEGSRVILVKG